MISKSLLRRIGFVLAAGLSAALFLLMPDVESSALRAGLAGLASVVGGLALWLLIEEARRHPSPEALAEVARRGGREINGQSLLRQLGFVLAAGLSAALFWLKADAKDPNLKLVFAGLAGVVAGIALWLLIEEARRHPKI